VTESLNRNHQVDDLVVRQHTLSGEVEAAKSARDRRSGMGPFERQPEGSFGQVARCPLCARLGATTVGGVLDCFICYTPR